MYYIENRIKAIVKVWNNERGFGFVEVGEFPHDYDLFFHITSCGYYLPRIGDIVTITKIFDKTRQKFRADEVVPTGDREDSFKYCGNRLNRSKIEEARKNCLKFERGCTCKEDLANVEDMLDLPYGRCWYCNEMNV